MGALFLTLVFIFILVATYFMYLLLTTIITVTRRVTWRSESEPVDLFTCIEAEKLKDYEQARENVRNEY